MDKGIEELIAEMKAAAEKAGCEQWQARKGFSGVEVIVKGSVAKGRGCVSFQPVATDLADDKTAKTVALFSPANVMSLIAALEQAQKESKVQRDTIANLTELWNEQRLRIAELEAASVKSVRLPGRGGVESSTVQSIKDWSDGWAAYREEAIKAIRAAGGSVEGSD